MGNNSDTHAESEPSLSRRSALAMIGFGAALVGSNRIGTNQNTTVGTGTGFPVRSAGTTEELDRTERHALKEGLPGEKFGSVTIDGFTHTLQLSGTRESSWMIRPFDTEIRPKSTSYQDVGSGIEYGIIPFPPGKVPVLRVNGCIEAKAGVQTSLRISIANRPAAPTPTGNMEPLTDGPVCQPIMYLSAVGSAQLYDEVYLTDIENVVMGMDNGHSLPSHTFLFEAKTDSPGQATISSATTLALDMEAL